MLEIQAKLRKLIALTKHTLVSIEAGDGAGSGVIISEDGLVLTAAHVIGKTGKKMHIRMHDGRRIPAVSLGGSELSDAGMLKNYQKKQMAFCRHGKLRFLAGWRLVLWIRSSWWIRSGTRYRCKDRENH